MALLCVLLAVAVTQGNDLLLDAFEICLMSIPHSDIFLHRLVPFCWDIDGAVGAIRQTLGDLLRVPHVCFSLIRC